MTPAVAAAAKRAARAARTSRSCSRRATRAAMCACTTHPERRSSPVTTCAPPLAPWRALRRSSCTSFPTSTGTASRCSWPRWLSCCSTTG
ncbi:hypothetical protein TSOC_009465 [Tetrabaena socialis]|uniref:Uncharacterized protein n=1 Tax=Tetrabaena socialis TaxID=47790 RepID=A0A2J7ZVS4_9CHLO|nr:hypothetical protein TSOC_009465 [Tetrabaena socialis]|eukprot:PNH04383.1 hypothetical protein TSOC_009465 [Tetrabaena socialis]